tara:strand:- start:247 stop:447 length:201 start_codon:yes stop_codon:yes gene_type:complete
MRTSTILMNTQMKILKTWKGEPENWVEISSDDATECLEHYGDKKKVLSLFNEGHMLQSPMAWYKKK